MRRGEKDDDDDVLQLIEIHRQWYLVTPEMHFIYNAVLVCIHRQKIAQQADLQHDDEPHVQKAVRQHSARELMTVKLDSFIYNSSPLTLQVKKRFDEVGAETRSDVDVIEYETFYKHFRHWYASQEGTASRRRERQETAVVRPLCFS